jgi:hypothetical protein
MRDAKEIARKIGRAEWTDQSIIEVAELIANAQRTAQREARDAALEEAAMVCEDDSPIYMHHPARWEGALFLAKRIRAIKSKEKP